MTKTWIGEITDVGDKSLWATLSDAATPHIADEVVELAFDKFHPEDRALIEPGATFYWTISCKDGSDDASSIRMRRLGVWTDSQIQNIRARAQEMMNAFS